MKKILSLLVITAVALAIVSTQAFASGKETEKVESATEALEEIMAIPETGIPPSLLRDAHGIAIIPSVIKVGFVLGGRYGRGILTVRGKDGRWSAPVFVSIAGGSVGWQIGAESTDVILVFKSGKSIDGILNGKFTLGADAAVAAGPVGRRAEAATDEKLKAEIYSYSRNRGLFAGVSLEGSVLQIVDESNAAFYGKDKIRPREILDGDGIQVPAAAARLRKALAKHTVETIKD
ncbi:MAG: hypothetical protein HW377_1684 [Actinobacteria bacterium]|nr:hypothetical protein [Actinomycetota bacterium]